MKIRSNFDALALRCSAIKGVRRLQARNKPAELYVRPPSVEHISINREAPIEQPALETEFVIDSFRRTKRRRYAGVRYRGRIGPSRLVARCDASVRHKRVGKSQLGR